MSEVSNEFLRAVDELCKRTEDGRELLNAGNYSHVQAFSMVERQVVYVRQLQPLPATDENAGQGEADGSSKAQNAPLTIDEHWQRLSDYIKRGGGKASIIDVPKPKSDFIVCAWESATQTLTCFDSPELFENWAHRRPVSSASADSISDVFENADRGLDSQASSPLSAAGIRAGSEAEAVSPTHRCNGVNGAERHGTQNKCTVCGEYREGWYDANGMEVRPPESKGREKPCTCFARADEEHSTYCPREGMDYDAPAESGEGGDANYVEDAKQLLYGYGFSSAPGLTVTDNLAIAIASMVAKAVAASRIHSPDLSRLGDNK